MGRKKQAAVADEEVVCEFFGIQVTTRNPNIARVLKTSVNEILRLDVKDIRDFLETGSNPNEPDANAEDSPDQCSQPDPPAPSEASKPKEISSQWSLLSDDLKGINELDED